MTTPDATFPPIQFNFLADHSRNESYCLAIERVVAKMKREGEECHCLDMGAGSGLLAMMAARSGADSVVACDLHGSVCQTARHVIARNNLSSRVTVVNRVSQPFSSPSTLSSPLSSPPLSPSPLLSSPLHSLLSSDAIASLCVCLSSILGAAPLVLVNEFINNRRLSLSHRMLD